ncbi:hypothetical protein MCERE1_02444 [Burkholderiaceae bacterium]
MPRIEASAPPIPRAIKTAPRKEVKAEPPRPEVAAREKATNKPEPKPEPRPEPKPEPKLELYAPARGARRG